MFKDSDPPIVPVATNNQPYSFLSVSEEQQVKEMASSGDFKGARLFNSHFARQNSSEEEDQMVLHSTDAPDMKVDINTNSLSTQNQHLI